MDDIFKVMVCRSMSETTYFKNTLFWRRHTDQWFAVGDHLVGSCLCVVKNIYVAANGAGELAELESS